MDFPNCIDFKNKVHLAPNYLQSLAIRRSCQLPLSGLALFRKHCQRCQFGHFVGGSHKSTGARACCGASPWTLGFDASRCSVAMERVGTRLAQKRFHRIRTVFYGLCSSGSQTTIGARCDAMRWERLRARARGILAAPKRFLVNKTSTILPVECQACRTIAGARVFKCDDSPCTPPKPLPSKKIRLLCCSVGLFYFWAWGCGIFKLTHFPH